MDISDRPDVVRLAIIGAGPGGLAAARTAAACGISHVLLERSPHVADTQFKYQKGKAVMAHPLRLPLLEGLPFAQGSREAVLAAWEHSLDGVNVRLNAEIVRITGALGNFRVALAQGGHINAEIVVLAVGLQGDVRRLTVPGADAAMVQYQLDDPEAYRGERIIVVGAGDAGIENALALAAQNEVTIINRAPDFSRAKPGNLALIERAVRTGTIQAYHNASPARVGQNALVIETREGEVILPADRIIARLGAIPPRNFLEACGVRLPGHDPAAVPELSDSYECNVSGIYIIGALAGYTLIKHAINQGHELVHRLAGRPVPPADEALLQDRFADVFPGRNVRDVLEWLRARLPMLAGLTVLQLREAMLESRLAGFAAGDTIMRAGDYTSSLWLIAEGAAFVQVPGQTGGASDAPPAGSAVRIGAGEFFGEIGMLAGRRRDATVRAAEASIMVEIPRRMMRRLQSASTLIGDELDRVAIRRIVHTTLAPGRPVAEIEALIAASSQRRYKAGDIIISMGDAVDALYILRSGSAVVTGGGADDVVELDYIEAGAIFGERGFIGGTGLRAAQVRATIAAEAVRIEAPAIRQALEELPYLRETFARAVRAQLEQSVRGAIADTIHPGTHAQVTRASEFLLREGIGEATNALFIDENLCTRCGNCESACAATHGGISRLSREAGRSAVSILLPVACRHCENPHCMTDCPPDAISRAATGEVIIDAEACIGCSNCANNCPYGVISMVDEAAFSTGPGGLLGRLLAGIGLSSPRRTTRLPPAPNSQAAPHSLTAVKCDLCRGGTGGPACVTACPTGAAVRMDPDHYMAWLREGRGRV